MTKFFFSLLAEGDYSKFDEQLEVETWEDLISYAQTRNISLSHYKTNHRNKTNFKKSNLIGFDIDNETDIFTIEDAKKLLNDCGLCFVILASKSHGIIDPETGKPSKLQTDPRASAVVRTTEDGTRIRLKTKNGDVAVRKHSDAFRIILPLEDVVEDASVLEATFINLAENLGIPYDPATKDQASRFWYAHGDLLVDGTDNKKRVPIVQQAAVKQTIAQRPSPPSQEVVSHLVAKRAIPPKLVKVLEWLEEKEISNFTGSDRDDWMKFVIFPIGNFFGPNECDWNTALDVADRISRHCEGYEGIHEVEKALLQPFNNVRSNEPRTLASLYKRARDLGYKTNIKSDELIDVLREHFVYWRPEGTTDYTFYLREETRGRTTRVRPLGIDEFGQEAQALGLVKINKARDRSDFISKITNNKKIAQAIGLDEPPANFADPNTGGICMNFTPDVKARDTRSEMTLTSDFLSRIDDPIAFGAMIWAAFDPHFKTKQALYLHGEEGNDGKSTFMNALFETYFLRPTKTFITLNSSDFSQKNQFGLQGLEKARIIYVTEPHDGATKSLNNMPIFKSITGDDWIKINAKNKAPFDIRFGGLVWFVSNFELSLADIRARTLSRWLYLGISTITGEKTNDAENIYKREMPLFLAFAKWCFEQPGRVKANGEITTTSTKISEAIEENKNETERSIAYRIAKSLYTGNKQDRTSRKDISNTIADLYGNDRKLINAIYGHLRNDFKAKEVRIKGCRFFDGVSLKNANSEQVVNMIQRFRSHS